MLRLLANENVPRLFVARLHQRSHDVRWIWEEQRGIADPRVLAEALEQRRVLLTSDKDFGELVFRQGKQASCGVILIRLVTRSQAEFVDRVLSVLEAYESRWIGHFAVIGNRKIRIVELPESHRETR
jgi:predicted nuclease of predicted toxin-antitoxin system